MKKYCILISTAILSIFALSCSKNEIRDNSQKPAEEQQGNTELGEVPEGYVRLVFGADAELTRTSIADGENGKRIVSWVAGDTVKVSYAGGSSSTQAAESGALTHFTVDVPQGTEQLYFSYPYDAAAALNASTLSLTIPAEQDGAFANANYVLAAASVTDENVHFYNAGALFKVVLDDASITKAVISGNNGEALCGTVPFTFSETGITPGTPASTGTSITINFNGAGTYYVSALPDLSLSDGATIRFYRDDKPAGSAKWSGQRLIERAQIASWGNSDAITNRYVKADAATGGNGRTTATAWGPDEFKAFLSNSAGRTNAQLELMNGIKVHVAAGSYTMPNVDINLGSTLTDLTIIGETGTIFAGDGSNPILHQNRANRAGTNITFDNITFSGGRRTGDHGGAIYQSYGTLTYKNCTFTDNQVLSDGKNGGALHFYTSPIAVFEDCTFTNNAAAGKNGEDKGSSNGGAVSISSGSANLTFTRCQFYGNSASQDGGAVSCTSGSSTALFDDCDFGDGTAENQNVATNYGGAFYIDKSSSLRVVNCRFNNNSAQGGGSIVLPSTSTVAADAVHFEGCTFTNHSVSNYGGVLRVMGGVLNLEKNETVPCTITDNTAASGGAIYIGGGTINDNSSVYKRNHANWGGVTLTSGGTLNHTSSIFGTDGTAADKNYAEANESGSAGGGGVINCNGGDINLVKCAFYGNEAQNRPGGVLRRATDGDANTITIKGCTFKGNASTYDNVGGGGGCVYIQEGTLLVQKADDGTRNTFLNNNSYVKGGAICVAGDAVATISESDFTGNTTNKAAYQQAGGALTVDGTADVSLTDCSFTENYTQKPNYAGGAIGTIGTTTKLKVNQCLFKGNHAQQGGAIATYSIGGTVYLNACAFTGNHSYGNYGCVILLPTTSVDSKTPTNTLCMNNCSFADNQYTNSGNGQQSCWVNMKGLTKAVVSNCTLIGRTKNSSGNADSTYPNLLRFDGNVGTGNYLINNIIAMTPTSGSFYSSDMASSTVTGYYNKMSLIYRGDNYTAGEGSASDFKGTSDYFGGLGTAMTEGNPAKWDNCYWSWNGTLATGGNLNMASLANVNSTIQTADANFYTWLDSIGALTTDCRGKNRGTTTWPGAYDGTNE